MERCITLPLPELPRQNRRSCFLARSALTGNRLGQTQFIDLGVPVLRIRSSSFPLQPKMEHAIVIRRATRWTLSLSRGVIGSFAMSFVDVR